MVQIETLEAALGHIPEEIASMLMVLTGCFFGPADLAADMGLLGQLANEDLWSAIAQGAEAARRAGKPSGTLVGHHEKAIELFKAGFGFVACSSDLNLLVRSADAQLAEIRGALK